MGDGALPEGDPGILESPLEASLELADLTSRRLPDLKRRSAQQLVLGIGWTLAVGALTVLALAYMLDHYIEWELRLSLEMLVSLSLTMLLLPSMGLGLALLIMAYKERQFLPFLENASGALLALGGAGPAGAHAESDTGGPERPPLPGKGVRDPGRPPAAPPPGDPLKGILGSALWVGRLVPTAERSANIARAAVALLLLSLAYLGALVVGGLFFGAGAIYLLLLEVSVLSSFALPISVLLRGLQRDVEFYRYHSRRHGAILDTAALGPPKVPGGEDHLARFDAFIRARPGCREVEVLEDGGPGPDPPLTRAYACRFGGGRSVIVVKLFGHIPDREELSRLLEGARLLERRRGIPVSRAVALVAARADDLGDDLYDHVLDLGRRTRPGECALQLVMEADGTYSMVPYIAG